MASAVTLDDLISDVANDVTEADVVEARKTAEFLSNNPVAFVPVRMFALDE